MVLFPADILPLARKCWQHAGMGISSRYAEHCLSLMQEWIQPSALIDGLPAAIREGFYSAHDCVSFSMPASRIPSSTEEPSTDNNKYLEDQFGCDFTVASAAGAKITLRRRIAGILVRNSPEYITAGTRAMGQAVVTEKDVFLFPTGMCAIWNAYELVMMTQPAAKSVCFGWVVGISLL